ncbi:MAG: hypothetical protein JXR03_03180 [Cyclobacteriaceae bacterium]
MNRSILPLIITLITITSFSSFAQETDDDLSDYSYLWEDTKKKKKKSKKNGKKQKEPSSVTIILADSTDSLKTIYQVPLDSIDSTLQQPESIILGQDSIPPTEEILVVDSTRQEEKEPKERWRDKEIEPVDDFRASMGAGTSGSFTGGVTYTQIGSKGYVGLVLSPEFSIGKVGVGLNVPILYGLDDQSIRTEIFKGGVGPLRLVRYVRYGAQKKDPIYLRVGELSGTMIGFGGLVNNYTNTTSYEKRKVGLHFDFNIMQGLVGMEGLYSDFDPSSLNLLAIRPYSRPLIWSTIPIVRTLEIGTTFIKDKDQTSRNGEKYTYTKNGIGAFGIDMGLVLVKVPFIQIDLFANYSSLNVSKVSNEFTFSDSADRLIAAPSAIDAGSGVSAGMNFRFHFIADVFSTDVRIERLSYSDGYLPQFFDAAYELNKDAKIASLANVEKIKGTYGSLTGHILQVVQLKGSLLLPDKVSAETPATVRISADLERLANKFSMHASYVKGGLDDLGDAFSFDERSLAKLRFIYHLNKFLATGVDYYYYWEPNEEGQLKATRYVMPYFGVSIQF